jgi:hypothetical protein
MNSTESNRNSSDIMLPEVAAEILVGLKKDVTERCPSCHTKDTYITHASKGFRICNGCDERFCMNCLFGSRYCCAYVYQKLPAPSSPLVRQKAMGVQISEAEEKRENK